MARGRQAGAASRPGLPTTEELTMRAVVLAGGFGTRITPLTHSTPKPMLPLAGKPILEHIVELLRSHGFCDLVILLYFQPDAIRGYFGDGSDFGVNITYTLPPEDYGTAGALRYARDRLEWNDTFLVMSGDLLTDADLSALVRFHREKGAVATLGLTTVSDPLQFGIVITDSEGRVVKFLEKPGWGEVFSDSINAGIYVMEPEVFDHIPKRQPYDFGRDLFPRLLEGGKPLYGCLLKGYWRDVGDTTSYWHANADILRGKVKVKGKGKRLDIVGKNIWLADGVEIAPESEVAGTVIVGEGSVVRPRASVKDSVIGKGCVIEEGASVVESVLWDGVRIGPRAGVEGSVVCSGVVVEEGARLEKGVVVAPNCRIGRGAVLREGVKVWPSKEIESRAVVSSNVIWGERWRRSLFEEAKVKGLANFELTPELAAKLGAAFATFLSKGSTVLMGRDAYRAPRMIKRAFVAGVLSAGVNVNDLKEVPIPVLRYRLAESKERGGTYFRYSLDNPEVTEILFYGAGGYESSAAFEKSFERVFQREDFRRVTEDAVGRITDNRDVTNAYMEAFLETMETEKIKEKKFRIVVDFSFGPASRFFPSILNELGCEVVSLNGYTLQHQREIDFAKSTDQLSAIVTATASDAAFWLDPWGERVNFVDERGRVYAGLDSLLLMLHLFLKCESPSTIVLPLFVPSYVDCLAREYGFSVRRAKNNARAVSEGTKDNGARFLAYPDGGFIFPAFHKSYDGMFALAKVLEYMAALGATLSEVAREIPPLHFYHTTVACPWEQKGVVMRKASEYAMDKDATFLDGVRIAFDGSWVLIFPDQYKSFVHIYVEADSKPRAEALLDEHRRLVEQWVAS